MGPLRSEQTTPPITSIGEFVPVSLFDWTPMICYPLAQARHFWRVESVSQIPDAGSFAIFTTVSKQRCPRRR